MTVKQANLVQVQNDYAVVDVADNSTTVFTGPCILYGIFVNTVLSAHTCLIADGSTTVITLAASTAANSNFDFQGIRFETSLVVDPNDAGTGGITVFYRPVNPTHVQ